MLYVLGAVQLLICFVLVILTLSQNTKQEGLGGTIMGRPETTLRGSKGIEEKISNTIKWLSYSFITLSFIIAVVNAKFIK